MPSRRNVSTRGRKERAEAAEATLNIPDSAAGDVAGDTAGSEAGLETTGRFIVVFKEGTARNEAAIRSTLNEVAGLRDIASSTDFKSGAVSAEVLDNTEVVHFSQLGIAVVSGQEAVASLASTASDVDSPILSIEPEYVARLSAAAPAGGGSFYLRGYRDAVNHIYDQLYGGEEPGAESAELRRTFEDTDQFTWGLQATGVNTSRHNGQGVKVAVLDTGFDFQHPDFGGRVIESETFSGFPVQDVHGHGTHCVGTACGSLKPATGVRRYGVATSALIYVGKVFNNDLEPGAPTGNVIAGIEWAATNGCRVVSLSLGVRINQQLDQYSEPIRRALNAGTLVVCAAGNNANRQGSPGFNPNRPATEGFVEPPANADHSLAVAAVDSELRIARFSARSSQLTGVGGKVNIAGPGVAVYSSVPVASGSHSLFNGTSMATPHVAGIAALWAGAEGLSGIALWNRLVQSALPLSIPSADVGAGLVQAPQ
jgi:subtilisin family serine protease